MWQIEDLKAASEAAAQLVKSMEAAAVAAAPSEDLSAALAQAKKNADQAEEIHRKFRAVLTLQMATHSMRVAADNIDAIVADQNSDDQDIKNAYIAFCAKVEALKGVAGSYKTGACG